MKFREYVGSYKVKGKDGKMYITDIPPNERDHENIPDHLADKVDLRRWLQIKGEGGKMTKDGKFIPHSYGKAANGKWYGWSGKSIYGYGVGDEVSGENMGKFVKYRKKDDGNPDPDRPIYQRDYVIASDDQAKKAAINFAKNTADCGPLEPIDGEQG